MSIPQALSLENRNISVVGAGSGIGQAVAVAAAGAGARVCCIDIDGEAAERTAHVISSRGGLAAVQELDVQDPVETRACFEAILQSWGELHGTVHCPGINIRKPLLAYREEEFQKVIDLNLKGTFHVLQTVGLAMRRQRFGSLVVLSSIRSVVVEPGQAVYAATKAGMVQMVRGLAAELGPFGVRVNAIAPGVIDTPLTAPIRNNDDWYQAYANRSALRRWGRPEEVAGPAVFLLSEAASYMTGTVLFVDGGWTAVDGRFSPPGMDT